MRSLAEDPADRWPTAGALASAWTGTDDATGAVGTIRDGGTAGPARPVQWWNEAQLSGSGDA